MLLVKDKTTKGGYHEKYIESKYQQSNLEPLDLNTPFVQNSQTSQFEGLAAESKLSNEDRTFVNRIYKNINEDIRSKLESSFHHEENEEKSTTFNDQSIVSLVKSPYRHKTSALSSSRYHEPDVNHSPNSFSLGVFLETRLVHENQNSKVSAVGQMITEIGAINKRRCPSIKKLFLSNNSIHSLVGISQLRRVECLSLANNLIHFIDDLCFHELQSLTQLEFLILEGNRVCYTPMYREKVISQLSNLQKLDQTVISREERNGVASILRREETLRETCVRNLIEILWKTHLKLLLACHSEMLHSIYGGFRVSRNSHLLNPSFPGITPIRTLFSSPDLQRRFYQDNSILEVCGRVVEQQLQSLFMGKVGRSGLSSLSSSSKCGVWDQVFLRMIEGQQKEIVRLVSECEQGRELFGDPDVILIHDDEDEEEEDEEEEGVMLEMENPENSHVPPLTHLIQGSVQVQPLPSIPSSSSSAPFNHPIESIPSSLVSKMSWVDEEEEEEEPIIFSSPESMGRGKEDDEEESPCLEFKDEDILIVPSKPQSKSHLEKYEDILHDHIQSDHPFHSQGPIIHSSTPTHLRNTNSSSLVGTLPPQQRDPSEHGTSSFNITTASMSPLKKVPTDPTPSSKALYSMVSDSRSDQQQEWDDCITQSKKWALNEDLLSFLRQTHLTSSPSRAKRGENQAYQNFSTMVNFSLPPIPTLPDDILPVKYKTSYSQARSMGGLQTLVRGLGEDVEEAHVKTSDIWKVNEILGKVSDGYHRKFQKQIQMAHRIIKQEEDSVREVQDRICEGERLKEETLNWIDALEGMVEEKEGFVDQTRREVQLTESLQQDIEEKLTKVQTYQSSIDEITLAISAAGEDLTSHPDLMLVLEEDELNRKVEGFRSLARLRRGFRIWRDNFIFGIRIQRFKWRVRERRRRDCVRKTFYMWCLYVQQKRQFNIYNQNSNFRKLKRGFDQLRVHSTQNLKVKFFLKEWGRVRALRSLIFWSDWTYQLREQKAEMGVKEVMVRQQIVKRRLFNHWRELFQRRCPTRQEEMEGSMVAYRHYKKGMFHRLRLGVQRSQSDIRSSISRVRRLVGGRVKRTFFGSWKSMTMGIVFHRDATKTKTIKYWMGFVKVERADRLLMIKGMRHAIHKLFRKGFQKWRELCMSKQSRRHKRMWSAMKMKKVKKGMAFKRWREHISDIQMMRANDTKAITHYLRTLFSKVMVNWKGFIHGRNSMRNLIEVFWESYHQSIRRKRFGIWRGMVDQYNLALLKIKLGTKKLGCLFHQHEHHMISSKFKVWSDGSRKAHRLEVSFIHLVNNMEFKRKRGAFKIWMSRWVASSCSYIPPLEETNQSTEYLKSSIRQVKEEVRDSDGSIQNITVQCSQMEQEVQDRKEEIRFIQNQMDEERKRVEDERQHHVEIEIEIEGLEEKRQGLTKVRDAIQSLRNEREKRGENERRNQGEIESMSFQVASSKSQILKDLTTYSSDLLDSESAFRRKELTLENQKKESLGLIRKCREVGCGMDVKLDVLRRQRIPPFCCFILY